MMKYITTFYSFIKIYFYNLLNVSGIEHKDSIKWVYYTYMGKRYRFPIKKAKRGPSMRDDELQMYFEGEPEFEEEIRGPFGDYHGMLHDIKKHYQLPSVLLPTQTPPLPTNNWRNLLFSSTDIENRVYFKTLFDSPNFREFIVNLLVDITSITRKAYELLNQKYKDAFDTTFDKPVKYEYNFDTAKEWLEDRKIEEVGLIEHLEKNEPFTLMVLNIFLAGFMKKEEKVVPLDASAEAHLDLFD